LASLKDWWNGKTSAIPVTAARVPFHVTALEQLNALAVFVKKSSNVLSPAVYSQLRSIDDLLRPLLKYLETHEINTEERFEFKAILTDYIPSPVNSFLLLHAKDQVEGGEADLLLLKQYQVLEHRAYLMANKIYNSALDSLQTQAIFVENRFRE
jgi:hypothetical protein